ncbi:hypothetical protein L2E82_30662 [Cichorium intybus]|uniref:Uncharacterized protein n=1 Tax=Cichorium intybus TaxID=13427 RepID=A0ACB9D100_CICIN|nr:hypothetical protein L2E82_30662 [Cichorium intybus]
MNLERHYRIWYLMNLERLSPDLVPDESRCLVRSGGAFNPLMNFDRVTELVPDEFRTDLIWISNGGGACNHCNR